MDEFWNVVAGGQTDMNGMLRPGAPIIIFKTLSQCMSSDADNGIHLWVKGFRSPEGVHRDAVLLDFVDGSFKVLLTNIGQEPDMVIDAPERSRGQNAVYLSPLRLKLAGRRLQVDTPKNGPFDVPPRLWREYNRIFGT
jgi:hypothetical protein